MPQSGGDYSLLLNILGADELLAASGMGNGGSKGGGASGGNEKKVASEMQKQGKNQRKSLGATLGIKFGIASLLKQSQVFTGFIGTIFQLMGALVDVILAPFLPILIPGIRLIAELIPYVSKYARYIYDFLDRVIFQWFRNFPLSDKIKDGAKAALSAVLVGVVFLRFTGLWRPFMSLLRIFFGKGLWNALSTMGTVVDNIFRFLGGDTLVKTIGSAIKNSWEGTGTKILTKLGGLGTRLISWADPFFRPLFTAIGTSVDAVKGAVDNIWRAVWTPIRKFLGRWIVSPLTTLGRFLVRPFAALWGVIGDPITKHLSALFDWVKHAIWQPFKELPIVKSLSAVLGRVMTWLTKELGPGLLGRAAKGAVGLARRVGTKTIMGLDDMGMPIKIAKKLALGLKAVPIIGAIAEAGFGGWATYKDFKKYGYKAAGGRLALTLANTTAALFDPTGLASAAGSIGSNIIMDQAYKRLLDPKESYKEAHPDIWVEWKNDISGELEWRKVQSKNQDLSGGQAAGISPDRSGLNPE